MIPTEPIGRLPQPAELLEAVDHYESEDPRLDSVCEAVIRDTIERLEATGSPVITDGEQRKYHNFWTHSVHGLSNTAPDGFRIPFSAGHTRRVPRLIGFFPFRDDTSTTRDTAFAKIQTRVPGTALAGEMLGAR